MGRALLLGSTAALLAACSAPVSDAPRHVLLISLDTFRADHLGCYGNPTVRTPEIDRFAADSVRFDQAATPATTTLAAHTSLFTGLYPRGHGVVRNGFEVPQESDTLAERLADAGFETAAFVASFALDRRFGIDQGFFHYDDRFEQRADHRVFDQSQRSASAVTDAVLAWLDDERAGERLFLFVHYFDTHASYRPPPPYDAMYTRPGGPLTSNLSDLEQAQREQHDRLIGRSLGRMETYRSGVPRELVERADGTPTARGRDLAALYAGETSYLDAQVGRLLAGLEERGILDETLVVLTADHGETFWEHADYWNHGLWVYETTVRVPLIVREPGPDRVPREIDEPVSTIDIFPTVLDLLGIGGAEEQEGRSLRPWLEGLATERGPIFSQATQPIGEVERGQTWRNVRKPTSVRDGRFKYIQAPYLGHEELYDLERDPEERNNLLAGDPGPAELAAAGELRDALDRWRGERAPFPSEPVREGRKETIERLRSLGYAAQ